MDPLDIIESTAEPAFATDETGRVVIWNTAAVRLLGYRPEDVLGKSCFEVICGRDGFGNRFCDETCNVVGMVLRKESINRFSLDMRRADGKDTRVWFTIISVPGPKPSQYTIIHILSPADADVSGDAKFRSLTDLSQPTSIGNSATDPATGHERDEQSVVVLTDREQEVLTLMAEGTSTASIADRLHISISTVRSHTQSILSKLDAHSKLEAVAVALRRRVI